MELKKKPKADLQNKRTIFFQIGMLVALAAMIVVFGISRSERFDNDMLSGLSNNPVDPTELPPITRNDEVKTTSRPLTYNMDIIEITKTNTKRIEVDIDEWDWETVYVPKVKVNEQAYDKEPPVLVTDIMPRFGNGDLSTFRNWVSERLSYPEMARQANISGRVTLSFVIEKDGSLTNIEVIQSPDRSLTEEAIRVLNQSPQWQPGLNKSTPVRVKYVLPLDFRIRPM